MYLNILLLWQKNSQEKKKGPITVKYLQTESSSLCNRSHSEFPSFWAFRKTAFSLPASPLVRLSCTESSLCMAI